MPNYKRTGLGEGHNSEYLQLSVKHGTASVMVSCCISASGVGNLVKDPQMLLDGSMMQYIWKA